MEYKALPLEIKDLQQDGTFTGYCAVYNNEDGEGDVVLPGAFDDFLAGDQEIPILWQHKPEEPIGVNIKGARSDNYGLWIMGKLTLGVQRANEAHLLMKDRAIKGLSIGYNTLDKYFDKGVRYLKKVKLFEYSPVTFPANALAVVGYVKSCVAYQGLPLADKGRGWDAAAAKGRIWNWAKDGGKVNFGKAKSCFLWCDDKNPSEKGSYKMPIADIIDGKPHVVFHAVSAAAAVLDGAHGNKPDIPQEDVASCKHHLSRYYKKFGEDPPFSEAGKSLVPSDDNPAGEYGTAAGEVAQTTTPGTSPAGGINAVDDFNTTLEKRKSMELHRKSLRDIHAAHNQAMADVYKSGMSLAEKKAAVGKNLNQFADALTAWHHKNLDMGQDSNDYVGYMSGAGPEEIKSFLERPEVKSFIASEDKSGRKISSASKAVLDQACEHMKSASALHQQGVDLMNKAHEMVKGLAVEANQDPGMATSYDGTGAAAAGGGASVVANTQTPDTKSVFAEMGKKLFEPETK